MKIDNEEKDPLLGLVAIFEIICIILVLYAILLIRGYNG